MTVDDVKKQIKPLSEEIKELHSSVSREVCSSQEVRSSVSQEVKDLRSSVSQEVKDLRSSVCEEVKDLRSSMDQLLDIVKSMNKRQEGGGAGRAEGGVRVHEVEEEEQN